MATPPNVTVTLTAEDRGVSQAIQALTQQLQTLAVQQKEVAASANEASTAEEQMAGSMHEARGAAALLGEETGIRLNRHLRGVLASSETLGPILSAAFPIAAAIGFTEVIIHAAEKMSEFISDLLIYTEDQKKAYELEVEFNKELIRHIDTMARLNKEYERMGKNAVQLANMDVRDLNKSLAEANVRLEETQRQLSAPLPTAGLWAQIKGGIGGFFEGGIGGATVGAVTAGMDVAQKQREVEVKKAKDAQDEITAALRNATKNREIVTQEAADKEEKALEERQKKAIDEFIKRLEQERKLADQEKKLADDTAEFWAKQQAKITEAQAKEIGKRGEAEARFRDESMRNEEQRAVDAISLQQREVEQEVRAREISGADAAAQLEELAQKKLDVENAYLDARIKEIQSRMLDEDAETYAKDLEEFGRLLSQKRAAEDKYLSDSQKAKQIAADADPLRNLQKTLGKDIERFFTEGITHARSFGDAMRGLAESVISSLQKMAVEFVLTAIKKKLLENAGGEGGGGGGVLGFIGGMFGLGHAEGGPIEGPGGPKSDIIPAMLSAGEFVMSADAVKALGTANLAALNKAAQSPAISTPALPHFAAGGYTGGDLTTSSEISMGIGLDEGLILRHMGSKAAGKVILQQLANNPKGAQRALSRTD
jgi:hypothetical protein